MRKLSALMATAALSLLGACGGRSGDAGSGWTVNPASEVHAPEALGPLTISQVMTGVLPDSTSTPPEFVSVKASARCAVPRASSADRVVRIYSYGGGSKSPLWAAYTSLSASGMPNFQRTDVIVTETERPVYLILDSYNSVLWNLQLAEGVRLSGVFVNSYEGSAVANVPVGVKTAIASLRGTSGTRCYRKFNEANVREVVKWLGAKIDTGILPDGSDSYDAALVGPVPAAPMPPKPMEVVALSDTMIPSWGTREDALSYLEDLAVQQYESMR